VEVVLWLTFRHVILAGWVVGKCSLGQVFWRVTYVLYQFKNHCSVTEAKQPTRLVAAGR
jgi:hypothetical protein